MSQTFKKSLILSETMVAAETFVKYILLFLATFPLDTAQVSFNINLCIFNIEVSH